MKYIAVLGHGTVGSGVCEIFFKNKASLQKKAGCEMDIKYVLDLRDFPGLTYSDRFTKDFEQIVNDPQVSVVAEVMGGLEPAYTFVKRCLQNGKSVTTSNKELVAAKGAELLAIAKKYNVNFLFEASVGGGIPIIRPLHACLAANQIDEIEGILNGTTNFILTKMIREQMSFKDALALAQQLGYAEKDPTADVEGHDACRKICILASLAFGKHIYPDQIGCEGITNITLEDVAYADDWGGVIKLIGRAARSENGLTEISVAPRFVSHDSQLANVDDVFNAVLVKGDATGEVVFYGKGAGKLPTGSAVVADIIDCIKADGTISTLHWNDSDGSSVSDPFKSSVQLYVRVLAHDQQAVDTVRSLFSPVQQLHREGQPDNELAFITSVNTEGSFAQKFDTLRTYGIELLNAIRILA